MEPFAIIVLLAAVAVLFGVAVLVAATLFLWYTVGRLQPIEDLELRLSRNNALCEALEAQVAKLRTSKAGRVSNARRVEKEQQAEEEEDPFLAGLTPEERSMFQ